METASFRNGTDSRASCKCFAIPVSGYKAAEAATVNQPAVLRPADSTARVCEQSIRAIDGNIDIAVFYAQIPNRSRRNNSEKSAGRSPRGFNINDYIANCMTVSIEYAGKWFVRTNRPPINGR